MLCGDLNGKDIQKRVDICMLPRWCSGKECTCQCRKCKRCGFNPKGLGRSPGEGNGNPLQYSCLGDPTGGLQSMGLQRLSDWAHAHIHVSIQLIHLAAQRKPIQYCKAIFIPKKISNNKNSYRVWSAAPPPFPGDLWVVLKVPTILITQPFWWPAPFWGYVGTQL